MVAGELSKMVHHRGRVPCLREERGGRVREGGSVPPLRSAEVAFLIGEGRVPLGSHLPNGTRYVSMGTQMQIQRNVGRFRENQPLDRQGPPAGQTMSKGRLCSMASATGCRNDMSACQTCEKDGGAPTRALRLTKACHCAALACWVA